MFWCLGKECIPHVARKYVKAILKLHHINFNSLKYSNNQGLPSGTVHLAERVSRQSHGVGESWSALTTSKFHQSRFLFKFPLHASNNFDVFCFGETKKENFITSTTNRRGYLKGIFASQQLSWIHKHIYFTTSSVFQNILQSGATYTKSSSLSTPRST